jgi:hypothetical protein
VTVTLDRLASDCPGTGSNPFPEAMKDEKERLSDSSWSSMAVSFQASAVLEGRLVSGRVEGRGHFKGLEGGGMDKLAGSTGTSVVPGSACRLFLLEMLLPRLLAREEAASGRACEWEKERDVDVRRPPKLWRRELDSIMVH